MTFAINSLRYVFQMSSGFLMGVQWIPFSIESPLTLSAPGGGQNDPTRFRSLPVPMWVVAES